MASHATKHAFPWSREIMGYNITLNGGVTYCHSLFDVQRRRELLLNNLRALRFYLCITHQNVWKIDCDTILAFFHFPFLCVRQCV